MAMSLTQPVVGSTGWGVWVNQNFQTLQDFCNNVASALLNAVPVMTPPSPGDGVQGLVPGPGVDDSPNFLAGDGEWRQAGGPWGVVPVMVGANGSAGAAGLAPAPGGGCGGYFLRGDASWQPVVLVASGSVAGQLLVWTGSIWQVFGIGNEGEVLTMRGGQPAWVAP